MTGPWVAPDAAASVERLVDAVLLGEAAFALPGFVNLVSVVGDAYGEFFGAMGAQVAAAVDTAAEGRLVLTVEQVVTTTADVVCGLMAAELTASAAVVLLLSHRLAELTGSDLPTVLRHATDPAREVFGHE